MEISGPDMITANLDLIDRELQTGKRVFYVRYLLKKVLSLIGNHLEVVQETDYDELSLWVNRLRAITLQTLDVFQLNSDEGVLSDEERVDLIAMVNISKGLIEFYGIANECIVDSIRAYNCAAKSKDQLSHRDITIENLNRQLKEIRSELGKLKKLDPKGMALKLEKLSNLKSDHKSQVKILRAEHQKELAKAKEWKSIYTQVTVEDETGDKPDIIYTIAIIREKSVSTIQQVGTAIISDLPFRIVIESNLGVTFDVSFTYFGVPVYPSACALNAPWPSVLNDQVHLCLLDALSSSEYSSKRNVELHSAITRIKKVPLSTNLECQNMVPYKDVILGAGCKSLWGVAALSQTQFISQVNSNLDGYDDKEHLIKAHNESVDTVNEIMLHTAKLRKFKLSA